MDLNQEADRSGSMNFVNGNYCLIRKQEREGVDLSKLKVVHQCRFYLRAHIQCKKSCRCLCFKCSAVNHFIIYGVYIFT